MSVTQLLACVGIGLKTDDGNACTNDYAIRVTGECKHEDESATMKIHVRRTPVTEMLAACLLHGFVMTTRNAHAILVMS